jgi:hypothetical protein
MVACLLAAVLAAAAPPKLAVLAVTAGEGVPPSTAAAITEAVAGEVRKQSKAEVITQREIASILSLENQKAMLGCQTDACMAELGGALGTDRLVAGDMAKLGESFLLHLRVVETKKVRVIAQADRRLRGGTIDDVLDVLPAMVAELFPPQPAVIPPPVAGQGGGAAVAVLVPPPGGGLPGPTPVPGGEAGPAQTGPVAPPTVGAALSKKDAAGWTEEEEKINRTSRDRLRFYTDDDQLIVAVEPFGDIDGPLYAGDPEKLYRQRVIGGGREGQLAVSRVFWEPRVQRGAESELEFRAGRVTLTCGERKIPLRELSDGGKKRILAEAKFYAPPFRRIPQLLARDDQGAYFYVDAARDPWSGRPSAKQDLRLRYGRKGALAPVQLVDAISDPGGLVLVTGTGRLITKGATVEWVGAAARAPLTPVDVRDASPLVYGELGAYGKRLGTLCDGKL